MLPQFVIKQSTGCADIEFGKWAIHLPRIREVLGPTLPSGVRIDAATKSAAVRVDIPKFSGKIGFEEQREAIAEALQNTLRLKHWYDSNWATIEALGRELAASRGPDES